MNNNQRATSDAMAAHFSFRQTFRRGSNAINSPNTKLRVEVYIKRINGNKFLNLSHE
jgi:hypothetical protein